MGIELLQYVGQEHKLSLNLAMKQSLNMLQMPIQQLQVQIEQALVDNPLLEEVESNEEVGMEEIFLNTMQIKNSGMEIKDYEDGFNYIAQKKTLKDYLKEQVYDLGLDHTMAYICLYIVENIDQNGYLNVSASELAQMLQMDVDTVEKAINYIQELEPHGIGAKNLKECLKIQLGRKKLLNDKMIELIDHYLELVGAHKVSEIAKKMNVSTRKVHQMCIEIKKLEPKPARGFFVGEAENYIIPEAYIRKIDHAWYIVMNQSAFPKLCINKAYKDIIKGKEDLEACEYIKEKMRSAMEILQGIEKRNQTIYSILEHLIALQQEYFEFGEAYLKPMTIKDIANRIGMHESTVSRAIKEKYISTPSQMVLLKNFFTTGVESQVCEEGVSSLVIKKMIQAFIDKEIPEKPLSDQKICDKLIEKSIQISRRTVTKYREALGIPTASMRKPF